jgi:hypothetical protein
MLVVVTLYNVRLAMPQVATATFKQWAGMLIAARDGCNNMCASQVV